MYRLAGILGGIWIALCMASFLSGAILLLAGAPSWLPLPWSDLKDFVEGPDGRVYVGLAFYHRVLCYSRDGQFIASYRPPSGKNVHLAADARGHIYCLTSSAGDNLAVFNGAWQLIGEYSEPYKSDRVWRLQAEGVPALQPAPVDAHVADRPARPGDIIFGDRDARRSFACTDGTTLIRCGNHLERLSADGHVITRYAGPALLRPLTFPWPAFTAWPLLFLMGYIHTRKKQWASHPGVTRVGRMLLVDVLATVLLIAVVGSIWIGGLMVMIEFNNSHSHEGWSGTLFIPTVAWFFFWPLAFGWAWKIMQRKLGGPATLQSQ
jgi:hypothetical protein